MTDDGLSRAIARRQHGNTRRILEAGKAVGEAVLDLAAIPEVYRQLRMARVEGFLDDVNLCAESLSDDELRRLQATLNSQRGAEVLNEYVSRVLDTRSRAVRFAFAILYQDELLQAYPESFQRRAVVALNALSDEEAAFFLSLSRIVAEGQRPAPGDGPYAVYSIRQDERDRWLGDFSDEDVASFLAVLWSRGMILRDHTGGRLAGGGRMWGYFGWSDHCQELANLLDLATALAEVES